MTKLNEALAILATDILATPGKAENLISEVSELKQRVSKLEYEIECLRSEIIRFHKRRRGKK